MIILLLTTLVLSGLEPDSPVTWTESTNPNGTRTLTTQVDGHVVQITNLQKYPSEWFTEVEGHSFGPDTLGYAKQSAVAVARSVLNDVPMLMYKGHRIDAVSDTSGYYYNYMIDYIYNDRDLYFERRIVAVGEAKRRIDNNDLPKKKLKQ
jgi:hypothetical protein